MHKLFIYGTLKRGFPNYDPNMHNTQFIGTFQTLEAFPLVIGGQWFSPCLIHEPGEGHRVSGELFRVTDDQLTLLDRLESTHLPNGYERIRIGIEELEGKSSIDEAWTYFKSRRSIEGVHSAPLENYALDPRYIHPSQRPSAG